MAAGTSGPALAMQRDGGLNCSEVVNLQISALVRALGPSTKRD